MEDEKLIKTVKAAQTGDNEALHLLYDEYKDQVFYYIKNFVRNESDAEDVFQETFLSVFKSIGKLNEPKAFKGFIFTVAYRRAMDFHRKSKITPTLLKEESEGMLDAIEDPDTEFLPGDSLENEETRQYIANLVKELSAEQKNAVLLYYYKQMSISEISELLDCSEGTIKSRLNYARKYIRAKIDKHTKEGKTVIAVAPLPLLTRILIMEAEKNTLSAASSSLIWGGIETSLGIAGTAASTAAVGAKAGTTAAAKTSGTILSAKTGVVAVGLAATAALTAAVVLNNPTQQESAIITPVAYSYLITNSGTSNARLKISSDENYNVDYAYYNDDGSLYSYGMNPSSITIAPDLKQYLTFDTPVEIEIPSANEADISIKEVSTPALYLFKMEAGTAYKITNSSDKEIQIKRSETVGYSYLYYEEDDSGQVRGFGKADYTGDMKLSAGQTGQFMFEQELYCYIPYTQTESIEVSQLTTPIFYEFMLEAGNTYDILNSGDEGTFLEADSKGAYEYIYYDADGNETNSGRTSGRIWLESGNGAQITPELDTTWYVPYEVYSSLTGLPK